MNQCGVSLLQTNFFGSYFCLCDCKAVTEGHYQIDLNAYFLQRKGNWISVFNLVLVKLNTVILYITVTVVRLSLSLLKTIKF